MSLLEQITKDMKQALEAHDKVRTGVLRMLLSEFNYAMEADKKDARLDDEQAFRVLRAYLKGLNANFDSYPDGDERTAIAGQIRIVESYLKDEEEHS